MTAEIAFVLLFAVATTVAIVVRRLKVPYTVALVIAGLVLGATRVISPPHLTKELLYAVFLPGLLFEAAFHLELKKFWQNKLGIALLAVPGVGVSIIVTGAILTPVASALHFVDGFTLWHGLVFGALISATDPIAVVAMFKSLGVPRRLAVLIEGESLLNDGTAAVLFALILGVAMGKQTTLAAAGLEFARVVGMGLAIGAATGFAASRVIRMIDDPMIEITLTTLAGYGSFVFAEHFHFSGVISTVAAGMICGNYAAKVGMSPTTRIAVQTFWEYIAFALNSIVFLLIGFEVRLGALAAAWRPILVAYLAVTLGRALTLAVVAAGLHRTRERVPWRWTAVLTWGGLRGGLSMVLVLGLPLTFTHRELLVTTTFGVVLLSILIQGLTMPTLLRRLRLVIARTDRHGYEKQRAEQRVTRAATEALDRMSRDGTVPADVLGELRSEYDRRAGAIEESLREAHQAKRDLHQEELRSTRRQLLLVEKDHLLAAQRQGLIGHEPFEQLLAEIDERLVALEIDGATAEES